jgi:hypothetical protein
MLPVASFFAPWWVDAIEVCLSSWQLAQTGVAAEPCAKAAGARRAARMATAAAAMLDLNRM